ncbi:MAG: hypothetical protein ACFB9M_08945 [Myxococcota bacterium]
MKKRIRRFFTFLLVVGIVGAGTYAASWVNSRRYFLVVAPGEVRVEKGRWLPFGHEPFIPEDPTIRPAYRSFPLPGGMKVGRGTTVFDDRVELDQALFRILVDAAEYALEADNSRTVTLLPRYLEQMESIPGVSTQQQVALRKLERDAAYVRGADAVARAVKLLEDSAKAFREAARGTGSRYDDGGARAEQVERLLAYIGGGPSPESPATLPTSTTATTAMR